MDSLKIWWVSHISHSKTQNSSIDTIPLSLIVLEIFHKNDFSTLTLNAVFTPQMWKRGKIKKHVFLIFRSSITYPKIEMIGGGHLKYSPCQSERRECENPLFMVSPTAHFVAGTLHERCSTLQCCRLVCRLHCNIPATLWKHCRAILQWPRLCNVSGILRTHYRAILQWPRLSNVSGILRTHCRAILQCLRLCNISGILHTHSRVILQWPRLCNVSATNPQ